MSAPQQPKPVHDAEGARPAPYRRTVTSGLARMLADVVRNGIAERGWSQRDLAHAAGLSEKHVSQVLNGRASAAVDTWDRLLELAWPMPEE
jgi:ribosome-binding protein aMBF1 (putative translation factor)